MLGRVVRNERGLLWLFNESRRVFENLDKLDEEVIWIKRICREEKQLKLPNGRVIILAYMGDFERRRSP